MSFLKRIEVWVLLLIGGGAAIWVLTDKPSVEGDLESAESTSTEPALVIHRCTLERDYGNARLDIELRYRNASPRPFLLQPPDVKLMTGHGKEVPPFILPMERPPQIAAETTQSVRLRYWLESDHLHGQLMLELRGEKAEVKSSTALDLTKIENAKPRSWQGAIH